MIRGIGSTRSDRSPTTDQSIGEQLFGRFLPAGAWTLLASLKVMALANRLSLGGGLEGSPGTAAFVAQQSAAIGFTVLMAALFVVRRPVLGPRTTPVGAIVAIAGTWIAFVPVARSTGAISPAISAVSTGLIVVGVLIGIASMLALGRCFGIFPEARGLVTRGPYRLVRHPLYLGELISMLGFVVATASPEMAGLFFVQCVLQYWRALNEERALTVIFPEYEDYRLRTWRLIPGVL